MNYKKRKRLASIVALGGITLALIIIFSAQKAGSQKGGMIGAGVFIATCIATAIIDTKSAGKSKNGVRTAGKYDPLLLDERTKQHPDVQRLLQYTSVQKAFFDPSYLGTAEAQSDPNVRELLAVFDNILLARAADGEAYPNQSELNTTSPYAKELLPSEPARMKKAKRKPRQIAGMVLAYIGIALLIIPFIGVFIALKLNPEDGARNMSSFLFTAAPIGLLLIIVGSVIGRNR